MSLDVHSDVDFGGRFTEWVPLAEGAEGRLFRVRDRWTGRVSALKVGGGAEANKALLLEYRLLARLRHPCLIESRDLLRDGGTVAHLMEYVPALDPTRLWDEGGEAAVRAALIQALRGLHYLHRHGYVHGDVAPGNLLVWKEGDRWRAKVADLGLTLPLAEAAKGGVRGTPGFMAPETARGRGAGPASDLYALAATATAWIDGRGPWEGLAPAEALKRLAAGPDVPAPVRGVSPELLALLAGLGRAAPENRTLASWTDLRADAPAWGPDVLEAGVFGLNAALDRWQEWLGDLGEGGVGAVTVRGRAGTGRSTAARAMARRLVGQGWSALWDLPLGAMRDWLEATGGDPDPVRLARELGRRFEDKDVVVLWPERTGGVESRLLRAFVVGRDREGSGTRTCVVKVASAMDPDEDSGWLSGAVRVMTEDWPGPDADGLARLTLDLFPEEEDFGSEHPRPEARSGTSPLALVLLKRAALGGLTEAGPSLEARTVESEAALMWEDASPEARQALALLAWSDTGWRWSSLAEALGWGPEERARVQAEIGRLNLTRGDYERGVLQETIPDWLVHAALRRSSASHFDRGQLDAIVNRLERSADLHGGDLGLARIILTRGPLMRRYLEHAIESRLAEGRYEDVLGFWREFKERSDAREPGIAFVWEGGRRAAQRLGRFPEEVEILRHLLSLPGTPQVEIERRKMLADALFAVGDWQGAVAECEALAVLPEAPERDRVWAALQKAEFLWQVGEFDKATSAYEAYREKPGTDEALVLKFLVGRARLAAQVGDIKGMGAYLEEAESRLDSATLMNDPYYAHARAGLEFQKGMPETAAPFTRRAVMLAEQEARWQDFVRFLTRASVVAYDNGKILEAHRGTTQALSTALAMKSDRTAAMVMLFLGFYEVQLGRFGAAHRRMEFVLGEAGRLEDRGLESEGWRLAHFLASYAGFPALMARAKFGLKDVGSPAVEAYLEEGEGMLSLGFEKWDEARGHFMKAIGLLKTTGQVDQQASVEARLAFVLERMGKRTEAAEVYERADGYFRLGGYPRYHPIHALIGTWIGRGIDGTDGMEAFRVFYREHRFMDLASWGLELLRLAPPQDAMEVRRGVLQAIRSVSDSIDDPRLRKLYLSLPRIKNALLALRS
jgi:tetratricopeptide (TPR) repeat protein